MYVFDHLDLTFRSTLTFWVLKEVDSKFLFSVLSVFFYPKDFDNSCDLHNNNFPHIYPVVMKFISLSNCESFSL